MTIKLNNFLTSLKPEDFKGAETDKNLKRQAANFLDSQDYEEYEIFNGHEIHILLLCLLKDNI